MKDVLQILHIVQGSSRGLTMVGGPAAAPVELSYLDSRNGYRRVPRCCHLCAQAVTRSYLRTYLPPFLLPIFLVTKLATFSGTPLWVPDTQTF